MRQAFCNAWVDAPWQRCAAPPTRYNVRPAVNPRRFINLVVAADGGYVLLYAHETVRPEACT